MDRVVGIFLALFGLLFGGVGLWFFGAALKNIFMGAISKGWRLTTGNIVSSSVKIDAGDQAAQSGDIVSSAGYRYSVDVVYEYNANSIRHTARKVLFAETSSKNLAAVQAIVHRYPAGSIRNVYYDPLKPSRAVLEAGVQTSNFLTLVLGGLFALLGAGIFLSGLFGVEQFFGVVDARVLFRVVTPLGLIGGAVLLVISFSIARRARASRRWPSVNGVVVSSKILKELSSSTSNSRRVAADYQYKPEVAFEYTVHGVTYISNKVSFADYSANSTGYATRVTERYPEGRAVAVFYDPDEPGAGVLETSAGPAIWLFFLGGLFFLAVTALFLYIGPEKFE